MRVSNFLALLCVVLPVTCRYDLKKRYDASNLFDGFEFKDEPDHYTDGFAKYEPKAAAMQSGLARIVDGKVFLGVDNNTIVNSKPGRKSVRLEGFYSFDRGLLIADFDHLPGNACGIWPAFWVLNDGESYSEIDLIEGVSLSTEDVISMYTRQGPCTVKFGPQTGTAPRHQCYYPSLDNHVEGCGSTAHRGTFGDEFNRNGGGVWVLQVEPDAIRVWMFPHGKEPGDVHGDNPSARPEQWGLPIMEMRPDNCNFPEAWKKFHIIINITFCGPNAGQDSWAGWTKCAEHTKKPTCEEFVGGTPHAFDEGYFLIKSIKHFEMA